jgi:hypothetical protein
VPGSLVADTVRAATLVAAGNTAAAGVISAQVAALTEGVLRAMVLSKLKIALVVLVGLAVLGAGTGWIAERTRAAGGQTVRKDNKPTKPGSRDEKPDPNWLLGKKGQKPQGKGQEEKSTDDPEDKKVDLEKRLKELKQLTEQLTKQQAVLEIEIAVKKLKQSKDDKEQAMALEKILQAVRNYREKILKIRPDEEKKGR